MGHPGAARHHHGAVHRLLHPLRLRLLRHIKGVGPSTAIKQIMQHGSLERCWKTPTRRRSHRISTTKWLATFKECEAVDTSKVSFEFKEPDFEGLAKFLIEENSCQKERVDKYIERLK